jgi:uncharacterized membrane protein YphA (DoxX/SURF4 family)
MHAFGIVFVVLVRLLAGGLLAAAGAAKIAAGRDYRRRWLEAYDLLPARLLGPVALIVAVLEVVAGVALLLGAFGVVSGLLAAAVLVAVTLVAVATLLRGRTPSCGCYGQMRNELISWQTIVRNAVLVVGIVVAEVPFGGAGPGLGTVAWPLPAAMVAGGALAILGGVHWLGRIPAARRREREEAMLVAGSAGSR